jgi:dipeptidyl aminopeptidase/acylaminoacyl peptidase
MNVLCICLLVLSPFSGHSETQPTPPPPTEIFLAPLTVSAGEVRIGEPENITKSPGYDNQPFFTPDGRGVLFTANRDGKQTDIYRYDLASRELTQLTKTPESEYSPTVTPSGDRVSVIRVEGDQTQRLWQFPLAGGPASLVLADVKPVGYHAWADEGTLVLFILGDPPTLQVADVKSGKAEIVARNPGRGIAPTPRGTVSFVSKGATGDGEGPWEIVELDARARKHIPVAPTLPEREDYAWLPDGGILMASGSKVFVRAADAATWREVADLSTAGLGSLTRLAVSPDGRRLALVAEAPPQ